MALTKNRILRRHPRTGVTPYETIAKSKKQQKKGRSKDFELTGSDKLIYELVENNVDYAGAEFSKNLRFSTDTLTDILYDNIYYLLGEKFKEDEFINWLADTLVENGCVTSQTASSDGKQAPKEEVVTELDTSQYDELIAKVDEAVKLIQANKLNIFKAFTEVDDTVSKLGESRDANALEEKRQHGLREQQIDDLIAKLQGNYQKQEEYLKNRQQMKEDFEGQLDQIGQTQPQNAKAKPDTSDEQLEDLTTQIRGELDGIGAEVDKLQETIDQTSKESQTPPKQEQATPPKSESQQPTSKPQPKSESKIVQPAPRAEEKVQPTPPATTPPKRPEPRPAKLEETKKEEPPTPTPAPTPVEQPKQEPPKPAPPPKPQPEAPTGIKTPEKLVGQEKQPTTEPKVATPTPPQKEVGPPQTSPSVPQAQAQKPAPIQVSKVQPSSPVAASTPSPAPASSSVQPAQPQQAGQFNTPSLDFFNELGEIEKEIDKLQDIGKKSGKKRGKEATNDFGDEDSFKKYKNEPAAIGVEQLPMTQEERMLNGLLSPVTPASPSPQQSGSKLQVKPNVLPSQPLQGQETSQPQPEQPLPPNQETLEQQRAQIEAALAPPSPEQPHPTQETPPTPPTQEAQPPKQEDKGVTESKPPETEAKPPQEQKPEAAPPPPQLSETPPTPPKPPETESSSHPKKNEEPQKKDERKSGTPEKKSENKKLTAKSKYLNGKGDILGKRKEDNQNKLNGSVLPANGKEKPVLGGPPAPPPPGGGDDDDKKKNKSKFKGNNLNNKLQPNQNRTGTQLKERKPFQSSPQKGQKIVASGLKKLTEKKKPGKPGILTKMAGAVLGKASSIGHAIGNAVSKSVVGKVYRGIKKVGKFIGKTVKLAAKGVKKVYRGVKKTVKTAFKVAKFGAKTFLKASRAVGKLVVNGAIGIGKKLLGIAKSAASMGQGPDPNSDFLGYKSDWSGGWTMTKLGWRMIKFVGKTIWKGLKFLAAKLFSLFSNALGLKKFKNEVKYYVSEIKDGIEDKSYEFLVQPVAAVLVTSFGLALGIVHSVAKFMKWAFQASFERMSDLLNSIKEGTYNVLKETWGFFRRILSNPLTILILIAGIFFLFKDVIIDWCKSAVDWIKEEIIPNITYWISTVWEWVQTALGWIEKIGGWVLQWVGEITNPETGWVGKLIKSIAEFFDKIKAFIREAMEVSGKDTIDFLCMYLSGDTISMLWVVIKTMCVEFWDWFKKTAFMRAIFGIINCIKHMGEILLGILGAIGEAIWKVVKTVASWATTPVALGGASWEDVKEAFVSFLDPINREWQKIKDIFNQGYNSVDEEVPTTASGVNFLTERPTDQLVTQKHEVSIAARNLGIQGKGGEKSLGKLDEGLNKGAGAAKKKLQEIANIYQENAEQVTAYDDYIIDLWNIVRLSEYHAKQLIDQILTDSDLSQKLVSAMFFVNPFDGKLMSFFPKDEQKKLIESIRQVYLGNSDATTKARTILSAFEQINLERGHIVQQQGEIFKKIVRDLQGGYNTDAILDLLDDYLENNEFEKVYKTYAGADAVKERFEDLYASSAITSQLKSEVLGTEFGTGSENPIMASLYLGGNADEAIYPKFDFYVDEVPEEKNNIKSGIDVPSSMNVPQMEDPRRVFDEIDRGPVYDRWLKYETTRREMMENMGEDEVAQLGFRTLTFPQFRSLYEHATAPGEDDLEHHRADLTPEQEQERQDKLDLYARNKSKRVAAERMKRDFEAWLKGGKKVETVGLMNVAQKPQLWNIPVEGLSQTVLMFSPEWQRMVGASGLSDDQLMQIINEQDARESSPTAQAELQRFKEKQEEEERIRLEDERLARREREVLAYSAEVKDGYIEVKIGEDTDEMFRAYQRYNVLYDQMTKEYTPQELAKTEWKYYTWGEWIKFYRKKKGLPEDGIKRIEYKGKRKERIIDKGPRPVFTPDELKKYGIEMSKNGPVMIPIKNAMKVSDELMKGAETIYSIRDGLDVMKSGLDSESEKLKNRTYPNVAVGQTVTNGNSSTVVTPPPNQSSYASPQ